MNNNHEALLSLTDQEWMEVAELVTINYYNLCSINFHEQDKTVKNTILFYW